MTCLLKKLIVCAIAGISIAGTARAGEATKKKGKVTEKEAEKEAEKEKAAAPSPDRPPFKDLLILNGEALFGGKLALVGEDSFEVTFDKPGQMVKGFEGKGIMDEKSPGAQGSNRKFFTRDKDQVIPNLACVAIPPPSNAWTLWSSRFPVAGNVKVQCDFRIPNLLTRDSGFMMRVNSEKNTFLETDFFHIATKNAHGKVIARKATPLKEYQGPASEWFPRKDGKEVPVELAVEGTKFRVSFQGKEMTALDRVEDVPRGKVVFVFRKIVFTVQSLKISGKLDKDWCEAELAKLEKTGKLILKKEEENPPPIETAPAPDDEEKKKAAEEGKKKDSQKGL